MDIDHSRMTARRPWLAVLSIALGAFAFVTTEYMPVGVLPAIARDLGITPGTAGLMTTTPGIIAAFSAAMPTCRRSQRSAARRRDHWRHCVDLALATRVMKRS